MTVVSDDLRRSARFAYERSDNQKLKKACHAILEANPHDADARRLMGLAALRDDRPDLAEAWFRETTARRPDSAAAWRDLARALVALRREVEAEAILAAATARGVRTAGSLTMLGAVRARLGRLEDASSAFEAAVELNPARGDAYWGLADVGGLHHGDAVYKQAENLLDSGRFTGVAEAAALFALAEADRQAGRFAPFMERIQAANAVQRRLSDRRERLPRPRWSRLLKGAGAARKAAHRAAKSGDETARPTPVFLIGERCSGARLAEAMLAGEPGVFAAGEVNLFSGAVRREIARVTRRRDLTLVPGLTSEQRAVVRAAYLDRAARIAPEARWFVDRSPRLAAHADILRALFPEAAIIRLERPALQQSLDIHRRFWTDGDPMVNDLAAIGRDLHAARRAFARLEGRRDLRIVTLDADELAARPVEGDTALRAAAGLPVSLSTFSSPGVRLATADQARFPSTLFSEHADALGPLKRGLREHGR